MIASPCTTLDSQHDLIARARDGDQQAWQVLFDECYPKIRRVIRRRLSQPMRKHCDSTDIANEVMKSLAARFGDFEFSSVTDLRKFVLHAAEQKVVDQYRREHAQKRDIGRDRPFATGDGSIAWEPTDASPTPSQVAVASEEEEQLLGAQTGAGRAVLELKLQGYSNHEVALETGWNLRKVERFLKSLRDRWTR